MKTIVICSGYFNPIGQHHLNYLKAAKELGDYLYVIVNSDKQALLKKGFSFQDEQFRSKLISDLKYVTDVLLINDRFRDRDDLSVNNALKELFETHKEFKFIFANGGDQKSGCREEQICKQYGCEIMYGVGGEKTGSSTEILKRYRDYIFDTEVNMHDVGCPYCGM